MNRGLVAAAAPLLEAALLHRNVGRVCRPDRWTLGLELSGGATLGFCWHPRNLALGLCRWPWPRGRAEDVLASRLKGASVMSVRAVPGEPILRLELAGETGGALVWEAVGRSANALLLDEQDVVLWSGRLLAGSFRTGRTGDRWLPPPDRASETGAPAPDPEAYLNGAGPRELRDGLVERGRRALLAALASRAAALERRREAVENDRREGEAWSALEGAAATLIASGDLRRRGEERRRVVDYTRQPPLEVELVLDPARSVRENAEAIFKKAQRGRARIQKTARTLAELEEEAAKIAAQRLDAGSVEDLALLFPEAAAGRRAKAAQPRRALPQGVAQVPLPGEFAGYAGKTAAGNDWVSFRIGRGCDFWLHAADYPGCHVVVKNPRRLDALPFPVERAAALYAAGHSQAPPGNRVAVTLAQCKGLRRVPGSPGRVMVASGRTVFVDLSESR